MTTTEGLARDALLGIDVALPDGSTVRCKALPLATSIEFLELIEKYSVGDIGALRRILKDFPKAVEANGAFDHLTPGEVVSTMMVFFGARRTTARPTASETETPIRCHDPNRHGVASHERRFRDSHLNGHPVDWLSRRQTARRPNHHRHCGNASHQLRCNHAFGFS